MKEKTKSVLGIAVPVLMVLVLLLNAVMLYKIGNMDERLSNALNESEDVAQENGVIIGG